MTRRVTLPRRERCSPGCRGWAAFDCGSTRAAIQRCDDCHAGRRDAASDADAEHAAAAWLLAVVRRAAPIGEAADVWEALRNTATGRRALARAAGARSARVLVGHCTACRTLRPLHRCRTGAAGCYHCSACGSEPAATEPQ